MSRNVAVEQDAAGNLKLSKKLSTERIDGVAALVMAVDRMERHASAKPPNYQMFCSGGERHEATERPAVRRSTLTIRPLTCMCAYRPSSTRRLSASPGVNG